MEIVVGFSYRGAEYRQCFRLSPDGFSLQVGDKLVGVCRKLPAPTKAYSYLVDSYTYDLSREADAIQCVWQIPSQRKDSPAT